jgi:hypothetical protein
MVDKPNPWIFDTEKFSRETLLRVVIANNDFKIRKLLPKNRR